MSIVQNYYKTSMMKVLLAVTLLFNTPAYAFDRGDVIEGPALVIDGDTIEVDNVRVRLNGVAAPERNEPGGTEATEAMRQILDGHAARCSLTGEKTYNRQVGTCWIGTTDVGAALIASGNARDCARYSAGRYAALEANEARALPLPNYCR